MDMCHFVLLNPPTSWALKWSGICISRNARSKTSTTSSFRLSSETSTLKLYKQIKGNGGANHSTTIFTIMKNFDIIEQYKILRKEETKKLNETLRMNFHEEYHWLDEASRPKVIVNLPNEDKCVHANVLAVKLPVRENYGIMVKPEHRDEISEIGFGNLAIGGVWGILQDLPKVGKAPTM